MNQQPFGKPPRWWSPKPNYRWMQLWRPLRRYQQLRRERITEISVQGLDFVRQAIAQGHGILITPNHPGHGDCYLLWEALIRLRRPCYVMTAWQVFDAAKPFERLVYRQHGCFSVNREGNDLQAFRQAVRVLQETSSPLVIFPEGEVYHLNERVTPFREGTAAIVLSAIKRSGRPVTCIPCALKYQYVSDPTPELTKVMDALEERLYWRPRSDQPLADRIYRVAEGILRLKELEYLGTANQAPLPERIQLLADEILKRLEKVYGARTPRASIPQRVKDLRQQAIARRNALAADDNEQQRIEQHLDDLFFVVQLFSYPGDYVAERPTIERMAETIDKFEEDFLDVPTARVRGTRRGLVTFGQPIVVTASGNRQSARALTQTLEHRVQSLLNDSEWVADRLSA